MQEGKFNVIIDAFWGSSGKGKTSTWLADKFSVTRVSSSNFPNAGHCQTAETMIITDRGLERLGDVVARATNTRAVNMGGVYEDVSRFVQDGVRKTNLIRLKNGVFLECTDQHRYYVWDSELGKREWVRSMDLDPQVHQFIFPKSVAFPEGKLFDGSYLHIPKKNKQECTQPKDEVAFAEYLGLLVGDGYYANGTRVDLAFHTSQTDVLERVQSLYAEMGISSHVSRVGEKECFVISTSQVSGLLDLFRSVGLKLATKSAKETPRSILSSRKTVIGAYLRGLFDADGCVKSDRVTLSNCSESVMRDAQQMLYVMGVHSCLAYFDDKPGRGGSDRLRQWTLSVSGRQNLLAFQSMVGFASRRKQEKLELLTGDTQDQGQIVRISRSIRSACRQFGLGTSKRGNTRTSFVNSIRDKLSGVPEASELVEVCEKYHVVNIVEVQREYREVEVFDLTMPNTHSYLSNGCISHNTAAFEDGTKFVAKAIPTAAILKKTRGIGIECFLSPGSGFSWAQLVKEWKEAGKPTIRIHERASIVTDEHAKREREGAESTMHIASTMQGSAAAIVDKVLRKANCELAWTTHEEVMRGFERKMGSEFAEFDGSVSVLKADAFRAMSQGAVLDEGHTWLHEGSQGFALSIDHGSHYPHCLSGDSKVLMADGRSRKICDIQVGDVVLSKDDAGQIIPKKVSNYWKNPTGNKQWFNIVTETSVYNDHDQQWIGPKLTGDHKVQTTRGKVAVKDLVRGDQVFVNEYELEEDGMQIFLGSMLGDGSVPKCQKHKHRASLQISHGASQRGYALAKASILRSYIGGNVRTIRYGAGSFKEGNEQIRYESAASIVVKRLATRLGCYGSKAPNASEIVRLIDARGLAIWFQDDGQRKDAANGQEVILYTNGFPRECVEALASALESKFGLHFTVNVTRGAKKHGRGEKEYQVLRLSRHDHEKWFAMVAPYVHPDLQYTLPQNVQAGWSCGWNNVGKTRCTTETVVDIVPSHDFLGQEWCYDIEVDGTHNFFVKNDKGAFNVENCTSRNCTVQAALDHMAMPPQMLGDVYLNLRSRPIRVGNVVDENGKQKGYSGDFYPDCKELTWEQVARDAGMPEFEARALAERERTTVTKRIRRVSTFSYLGLRDAVRTNGATKLVMNFIQYVNFKDAGLKGGKEAFQKLSKESRAFIDEVERVAQVPVVLIGTGALHDEMISLL